MRVEKIDLPKTLTVETAKQFVGRIASVCTGVECRDDAHAERVGEKNLTEAYGDTPTRAWEFLPLFGEGDYNNFRGNINNDKEYYTLEELCRLYNTQYWLQDQFFVFHITAPRYVMAHLKTHTTLSSMMSSVRIGCNGNKEYEFPKVEKGENLRGAFNIERELLKNNDGNYFYENKTGKQFTVLLSDFYKRKEITKRPLSDFEVVEMKICGYSDAWDWFIKQRSEKGVQKETREIAQMIKELIKGENND